MNEKSKNQYKGYNVGLRYPHLTPYKYTLHFLYSSHTKEDILDPMISQQKGHKSHTSLSSQLSHLTLGKLISRAVGPTWTHRDCESAVWRRKGLKASVIYGCRSMERKIPLNVGLTGVNSYADSQSNTDGRRKGWQQTDMVIQKINLKLRENLFTALCSVLGEFFHLQFYIKCDIFCPLLAVSQ